MNQRNPFRCNKTLLLLLLACLLMASWDIRATWQINAFSLAYSRFMVGKVQGRENEFSPPPTHRRALVWMAMVALQKGDLSSATTFLDNSAISPLAMHVAGLIESKKGNYFSALNLWLNVKDWNALSDSAQTLLSNGDVDAAEQYYHALSIINPTRGIWPYVSVLWRNRDKQNLAIDVLESAVQSYPHSSARVVWMRKLGDLWRELKKWDEAERWYLRVLRINPNDYSAMLDLGWLYYEKDRNVDKALQFFSAAIELDPKKGDGYFSVASMLAQEHRFAEADIWYSKAIEWNPILEWYVKRGNTARDSGDLMLALRVYNDAHKRFPESSVVYYEQAYTYYLMQQAENAVSSISQAIALMSPPDFKYYMRAGEIYSWAGDIDSARRAYQEALRIQPENPDAIEKLQQLNSSP